MEIIKTNQKKIIIGLILAVAIALGVTAIILELPKNFGKFENEKLQQAQVYEAAIQVRDQYNSDPEEDARTCLKKGDVMLVLPENHIWSKTELISSLILKIKMTEDQAAKLTQPVEKENDKKREDKEEGEPEEKEVIKMRKYRVKIESLDFNIEKLSEGQPFESKVFEWDDIVEEKQ